MTEEQKEQRRQYQRDRRANKKRMCPQCGVNELDRYKKLCSECVVVNRQHWIDICQHNYFNKPEVKERRSQYFKDRYRRMKNER